MRPLLLALSLLACGAPSVSEPCEQVSDFAPCREDEVAELRCIYGVLYVCEPSIATCYAHDLVDGQCPTATDGGALRPELLGRHWMSNGGCSP